jgi:hypothetical protein
MKKILTPTTPSEDAIAWSRLNKALKLIAVMQSYSVPSYEWLETQTVQVPTEGRNSKALFITCSTKTTLAKIAGYEHVSNATWQFVERLYPVIRAQFNLESPHGA